MLLEFLIKLNISMDCLVQTKILKHVIPWYMFYQKQYGLFPWLCHSKYQIAKSCIILQKAELNLTCYDSYHQGNKLKKDSPFL